MSKMIRKIEAFNTEFKKPEFSRNSRNQELSEEVYSSEEENSYIITEEAKSQIILNGYLYYPFPRYPLFFFFFLAATPYLNTLIIVQMNLRLKKISIHRKV